MLVGFLIEVYINMYENIYNVSSKRIVNSAEALIINNTTPKQ
jgi:hypothetical protein